MLKRWVLFVLILNGATIVGFRYTLTLDGPLHIARAHLLLQQWEEEQNDTLDPSYDPDRIGSIRPLDILSMGLLKVASPEMTHQLIVALVVLILGLSCYSLVKALGKRAGPAILLVLPLTFNALVLFGFFNFILVVGLSFLALSWWVKHEVFTFRAFVPLALWAVALLWCHIGGVFLFIVLVAGYEISLWNTGGRKPMQKMILASFFTVAALVALIILFKERTEVTTERNALSDLLTLRPLLMMDTNVESVFQWAWGSIFIISLMLSIWLRLRSAISASSDGLWISAALLLVASLLFRTHGAYLFYFVERAQLVALLLLTVWIATVVQDKRTVILIAFASIGLQFTRQVFLEKRMAQIGVDHLEILSAAEHLTNRSIVVAHSFSNNWLLQHEAAWLICTHKGAIVTEKTKYWFTHGHPGLKILTDAFQGRSFDPGDLKRYSTMRNPSRDLEVFIIHDEHPPENWDNELLSAHFYETYSNDKASIYVPRIADDPN